jgi:hypothetical protein
MAEQSLSLQELHVAGLLFLISFFISHKIHRYGKKPRRGLHRRGRWLGLSQPVHVWHRSV